LHGEISSRTGRRSVASPQLMGYLLKKENRERVRLPERSDIVHLNKLPFGH
jgi:hypothetical protein